MSRVLEVKDDDKIVRIDTALVPTPMYKKALELGLEQMLKTDDRDRILKCKALK